MEDQGKDLEMKEPLFLGHPQIENPDVMFREEEDLWVLCDGLQKQSIESHQCRISMSKELWKIFQIHLSMTNGMTV